MEKTLLIKRIWNWLRLTEKKRPSFEEYGILLAHVVSLRSEDRFVKVGSVAFNKDKKIISTGYNGFGEGQSVSDEIHNNRDLRRLLTRHSETNCLSMCVKGEVEHLFLTISPCQGCAINIASHQIKNVYFSKEYERGGVLVDLSYREIFKFYGINYKHIPFDSIKMYFEDMLNGNV